jgi:hypothetical protein
MENYLFEYSFESIGFNDKVTTWRGEKDAIYCLLSTLSRLVRSHIG